MRSGSQPLKCGNTLYVADIAMGGVVKTCKRALSWEMLAKMAHVRRLGRAGAGLTSRRDTLTKFGKGFACPKQVVVGQSNASRLYTREAGHH